MDIIDAPQKVEIQKVSGTPQAQPVQALADLSPELDDNAVRALVAQAEAQGKNPMEVEMSALSQGSTPPATPPVTSEPPAQQLQAETTGTPDVPQKFLTTDGAVDVEKLKESTRQLGEALQAKETAVQKTVEEYLREYRELENKFRNTPNPQRLAAELPSNPPPMAAPQPTLPVNPQQLTDQQLEELINKDIQVNPGRTITQLIQLALDNRLKPIEEDKKIDGVRQNLQGLAAKDPRVLDPQYFDAINKKLAAEPDYWKLKNPHRAAWLDLKEELHLGEVNRPQAQPSRPPSPVLGGGTPPSTPSSQANPTPQNVLANLDKIDLRDRKQEAQADEAIRAMLSRR